MKVVSLLPSGTEIVCALGMVDSLAGVSHECDYPPKVANLPRLIRSVIDRNAMTSGEIDAKVVSSKRVHLIDIDQLKRIEPDVIITQEICNVCAVPHYQVLEAVKKAGITPNVVTLTSHTLDQVLENIIRVGQAVGKEGEARDLVSSARERIGRVQRAVARSKKVRAFCLEWMDPLMAAGDWVPEMVELAGGTDGLGKKGGHSTTLSSSRVIEYDPEVILVMPCGFPVERTMREVNKLKASDWWEKTSAWKSGRTFIVDGNSYFTRSGPRLIDGLEILAKILHPDAMTNELDPSAVRKI